GDNTEADWNQYWFVDHCRLRNLKKQAFIRLLQRWTLEHDETMSVTSGNELALIQTRFYDRNLFYGCPTGASEKTRFRLSGQLHLRLHQLHGLIGRIQD